MVSPDRQPRRKKADWLLTALEVLESEGIGGVRVERLARRLNVAKSGFYCHFENREHLYEELLRFWEQEFTRVVTESPEIAALLPAERLLRTAQIVVDEDLGRFELPIRAWAQGNPEILERVVKVYDERRAWIRKAFRDLGFTGRELEMRTQIFVGYHVWERTAFPRQTRAQIERQLELRIDFFVRP